MLPRAICSLIRLTASRLMPRSRGLSSTHCSTFFERSSHQLSNVSSTAGFPLSPSLAARTMPPRRKRDRTLFVAISIVNERDLQT